MIVFFDDEKKFISRYVEACVDQGWDAQHMGTITELLSWAEDLPYDPPAEDCDVVVVDIMFPTQVGIAAGIPSGLDVGIWILMQLAPHIARGRLRAVVLTNKRVDLVEASMAVNGLHALNIKVFSKSEMAASQFPKWLENDLA